MNKLILCICMCGMMLSCKNADKEADATLQAARQAYETGNYNEAKSLIDSIKIVYPKAYETRRKGNDLMKDVVLAEQHERVVYLDSLMAQRQTELEQMKKDFVLEKDTAYQQTGNYFHPSQVVERNLHRSFLRFQTDENGNMSMTSIYCGSQNIHHTAVKVAVADGTYAQTPASKDSYETSNLDEKIEKADYKAGEDGGVITFICLNNDKNISVKYLGDRTYSTNMSVADRQAAVGIYNLSKLLLSITKIKTEMEEADRKIKFVQQIKEMPDDK